jgi:hypothetical protein
MSTAVHITWHRAQVNFGDLSPFVTYSITYKNRTQILKFFIKKYKTTSDPKGLDEDLKGLDAEPKVLDADPIGLDADPNGLDADPEPIDANEFSPFFSPQQSSLFLATFPNLSL